MSYEIYEAGPSLFNLKQKTMALLKVADFRTSQDGQSGYVLFKVIQSNGSISNWIGWQFVPIAALASLQNILNSGNAYYDTESRIFTTGPRMAPVFEGLVEELALNPEGIENPIKIKRNEGERVKSKTNKKGKSKNS